MDNWSVQEDGIHVQLQVPCTQGTHPIEVCVTYEGKLRLVDNPCQRLGVFTRMTDLQCQSSFRRMQIRLLREVLVPVTFGLAKPAEERYRQLYEAIHGALATQALHQFPKAQWLSLALNGTVPGILEASQKYPLSRWGLWAQCVLLHRIAQGDDGLSPLFGQGIPLRFVEALLAHELADALVRIGSPSVPVLIQRLKDEDSDVRKAACSALGKLGDPSAIPALIEALKGRDRDVPRAACDALVQIGSAAVPALIKAATSNPSPSARCGACEALGKLGDPAAIPALIKALKDRGGYLLKDSDSLYRDAYMRVCEKASEALGELGDPSAVPALIKAAGDPSDRVRPAAYSALVRIGKPAVPVLIDALKDRSRYVRRRACFALGELGDPSAVPALIQALKDEDSGVRKAACWALGKLGDPSAVPALIQALKDEDSGVRKAACWALGKLGDPSAVPALIQALKDEDSWVRMVACEVLGKLGDPSAVPALIQALKDEHSWVREAARKALKRLGWQEAAG